jgi:proline iminopeptidase
MGPDAADIATSGKPGDRFAPLTVQHLAVGDGHEIYVETVGSADGIPAIYLHGGPGSGCQPDHRRLFDPLRFHAVLFDQRGAGRSRPKGSLEANTLSHLIADMELIRKSLGFEQWLVVGGSWGATLALAYAQAHPQSVSGIVLRAMFLGTREELEGAFLVNLPRIYPELNDDFLGLLPPGERDRPLDSYWRRILDADPAVYGPASRAWHDTERILSEHKPSKTRLDLAAVNNVARGLPATPFMEAHYFRNDCFMKPEQLLKNAARLNGIPGIVVQGRYDLLCPPSTAHALLAEWPDAKLRMVAAAGHSLYDSGVRNAVITATDEISQAPSVNSAE